MLLLTRPDCELCEHFQSDFAAFAAQHAVPEMRVANVDSHSEWQRRYGLRVPVLLCDSALVCAGQFDGVELLRLLRVR